MEADQLKPLCVSYSMALPTTPLNPPTLLQPTGLVPVLFQLCKNKTHAIKDILDLDLSSAA